VPVRNVLIAALLGCASAAQATAPPSSLDVLWTAFRHALGQQDSRLQIDVTEKPERRKTHKGFEVLVVTFTIKNRSQEALAMMAVIAELRDNKGRPVYSWTIPPTQKMIGPGEAVKMSEARENVPVSATLLNLSLVEPYPETGGDFP
jgi:hypothetical protein